MQSDIVLMSKHRQIQSAGTSQFCCCRLTKIQQSVWFLKAVMDYKKRCNLKSEVDSSNPVDMNITIPLLSPDQI
jgi:hypothetical protein